MCDGIAAANSFGKAFGSLFSGFAEAGMASARGTMQEASAIQSQAEGIDAKSRATYEAAQMQAMMVLTSASASESVGEMNKAYADQMESNLAAMAVSGVSAQSFKSIRDGNSADIQKSAGRIHRGVQLKRKQTAQQQRERMRQGEIEAANARAAELNARFKSTESRFAASAASFTGLMGFVDVARESAEQLKQIGWRGWNPEG